MKTIKTILTQPARIFANMRTHFTLVYLLNSNQW